MQDMWQYNMYDMTTYSRTTRLLIKQGPVNVKRQPPLYENDELRHSDNNDNDRQNERRSAYCPEPSVQKKAIFYQCGQSFSLL
jgi:hypothetical protein